MWYAIFVLALIAALALGNAAVKKQSWVPVIIAAVLLYGVALPAFDRAFISI